MVAPAPRAPSKRRRWVVLALAFLSAPLVAEAGLRFFLFSDSDLARSLGAGLRRAELYSAPKEHDAYWMLRRRFLEDPTQRYADSEYYHPGLGWVSASVDPSTLEHASHGNLAGRRPILLYGASYAAPQDWSRLVAGSDLAADWLLLSYGVAGYGMDQAYLLLRASLERFEGQNPLVVLGLSVDDDLDRVALSIRGWPKPRFEVPRGGALVTEAERVPRVREYFETRSYGIKSFLASGLMRGPWTPRRWVQALEESAQRREEKRARVRALVRAIQAEVEARGLDSFYFLFTGLASFERNRTGWQERLLCEELDALGVPYRRTRPTLYAASAREHRPVASFFAGPDEPRPGHPNAEGMRALFPALRAGVLGEFDAGP